MFVSQLSSDDARFKTLDFRVGLNILVADRTEQSDQGDSRNGLGKSSLIRVLRYLLGTNLPDEFKSDELKGHTFVGQFQLPAASGDGFDVASVSRRVSPTTRVGITGWSATNGITEVHVDDWRRLLAEYVFRVPLDVTRPTPGELWGQLMRTYFGNPSKSHSSEADWETGVKLGFFLGLAPEVLGKAGELDRLTKQRIAIRSAVRDGAIAHLSLDEADLRSQLATARRQRDRTRDNLRSFRVDGQYAEHQLRADSLSSDIRNLNDEALSLQRRQRELTEALTSEVEQSESQELLEKLDRVYREAGVVLPDRVSRRFDEVADFHRSVVRNRESFLRDELAVITSRIGEVAERRRALDSERADVLQLLTDAVALDTFLEAQRSLAAIEATVADTERRLASASQINEIDGTIRIQTAETVASVRAEVNERADALEAPIALFHELGEEIYADRDASLLISTTPKGILQVKPRVSGDASDGIRSVETFLLDIVCAVSAVSNGRAPGVLVHDSQLFDSIDGRQVASCLNIGARLAEQHGFQYIVTMNSDFLSSVTVQSDGAFDSAPYELDVRLTDVSESGGLFGFRFE